MGPTRVRRAGARGALVVEVRVRLGAGIARFASAPLVTLELPSGATVDDVYRCLSSGNAELGSVLRSAVPVVRGVHVAHSELLAHGDEVALLAPMSGG